MVTYQDSTDATAGDEPVESRAGRLRGEEPAIKRRRHYTISVAAEMVSVHQQTIRHYERLGLIEPYRGKGDIRYFSPDDIDKLMQIRRLVDELGVNLAGVEVILNMREQVEEMQEEFERRLAEQRERYENDIARLKEIIHRLQDTP
ncbi:MAG TPA: MerR family transcriptional regulator [Chloroflexota bacterium]|nr:MerR family transcriptional regulator [Chloroflexota bacterium]